MSDKIVPLNKLVTYKLNMYEATIAMIKQSEIISENGDEDVVKNKGKVVSTAIKHILDKKVEFANEEE